MHESMLVMESWSRFAMVAKKKIPSRVVKIIIGLEIAHNNSVEHWTDSEQTKNTGSVPEESCTTHITELAQDLQ